MVDRKSIKIDAKFVDFFGILTTFFLQARIENENKLCLILSAAFLRDYLYFR